MLRIRKSLSITLASLGLMALPAAGFAFGDPAVRAERTAELAAEVACRWSGLDTAGDCGLDAFDRTEVTDRVVQYTYGLRVGPGEFDRVTLYRVIQERRPYWPRIRPEGVMLVHGDVWPFAGAFMTAVGSGVVSDEQALPVFLANNRVDAWGIDLRWTGVPADAADPNAIMKDWGVQTDMEDIGVALQFMRVSRLFSGSGFQKVTLLGWSRGGITGYAYLGMESQRHPAFRQVKAFIPVDIYIKVNDESRRQYMCAAEQSLSSQRQQGIYSWDYREFITVGELAIAEPDGPSPIIPGFTNAGVVVLDAGIPRGSATPWFHYLAAKLVNGIPEYLIYTEESLAYVHYARAAPHWPNKLGLDGAVLFCDEDDSPFDDHLGDITVPVLYVAGDGGFSDYGVYSTTLLGSDDVETLIIDLKEENEEDFGHTDIFLATEAEQLVWKPMLDWIRRH